MFQHSPDIMPVGQFAFTVDSFACVVQLFDTSIHGPSNPINIVKKLILSTKSALLMAHAILWGAAIVASAIVLQGDGRVGKVILILILLAGTSLMMLGINPRGK